MRGERYNAGFSEKLRDALLQHNFSFFEKRSGAD